MAPVLLMPSSRIMTPAVIRGMRLKTPSVLFPSGQPRYSPDLNPLDYFLWPEIEHRMVKQHGPPNETVEAYKLRLKHVAKAIPASVIKAVVAKIKPKACEVVKAGGGKIRSD